MRLFLIARASGVLVSTRLLTGSSARWRLFDRDLIRSDVPIDALLIG